MAGQCTNGHVGPTNRPDCMYCGAPMAVPPAPQLGPAPPGVVPPGTASQMFGAPAAAATRPRPYSSMAVASLVVGIVSLALTLVLPVFTAGIGGAIAILLAFFGLAEIGRYRQRGTWAAILGLILGFGGVFLVVGVFLANGIVDKSDTPGGGTRDAGSCTTEVRTLRTAAEAYRAKTGNYPKSEKVLVDEGFLLKESERLNLSYQGPAKEPLYLAVGTSC